jgi:prevent-host-death family protein
MKRTVSAMEARRKFGEIMEGVLYRGDEVVIERAGKVMAVLVSPAKYEILQQNRERLYQAFEERWERATGVSYETAERVAVGAVRDVRKKRTGARQRTA